MAERFVAESLARRRGSYRPCCSQFDAFAQATRNQRLKCLSFSELEDYSCYFNAEVGRNDKLEQTSSTEGRGEKCKGINCSNGLVW